MSSGQMVPTNIQPPHHVVQLYRPGSSHLSSSVGGYLAEGLARGEAALVVATPQHTESFLRQLTEAGLEVETLQSEGEFVLLDAHKTLAEFMVEDKPNARLFERTVGRAVRDLWGRTPGGGLRAYGEMVGILWLQGQFSAAMMLEELWNDLLKGTSFSLFCSYPIDVFDSSFHRCDVDAVMCSHTHVVPEGFEGDLESAVTRALDETLALNGRSWKSLYRKADHPSWAGSLRGEALIVWIRETFPESADEVMLLARRYFDAAQERSGKYC